MPGQSPKQDVPSLAADAIAQLGKDKRVRLELPGGGRLQLDRRLPFLCVYRRPAEADPGTEELVTSEMAYMIIPAEARHGAASARTAARDSRAIGKALRRVPARRNLVGAAWRPSRVRFQRKRFRRQCCRRGSKSSPLSRIFPAKPSKRYPNRSVSMRCRWAARESPSRRPSDSPRRA